MKTNLKDFSLTPLGKVQRSTNRAGIKSVKQREKFPIQWAGGGALVQWLGLWMVRWVTSLLKGLVKGQVMATLALLAGSILPVNGWANSPAILYAPTASDIRVAFLVKDGLPDLDNATKLVVTQYCQSEIPPGIYPASNGSFVAIWWNLNTDETCYTWFKPDGKGSFVETYMGNWFGGATWNKNRWQVLPYLSDLNGDQIDDFVLIFQASNGAAPQYKVALGKDDGSFDFSSTPVTYDSPMWVIHTELSDVDKDGKTDLVFFNFPTGGIEPTNLYMLKGQGNGTFATDKTFLLYASQGARQSVLADFNSDGNIDVFLPPDDDVDDIGQSYISLGQGSGNFSIPQQSIDFRPTQEYPTGDEFVAGGTVCDLNLDGYPDILSWEADLISNTRLRRVFGGNGTGQFSDTGISFGKAVVPSYTPSMECINVTLLCPNSICNVSTGGSDTTGDGSETNPFATIQHGIDMAQEGYTVLVHVGTYLENIKFDNKNIIVKSKEGATNTIIDGNQQESVVTFIHDGDITLGAAATLQGFTITHGIGTPGNDNTYRTDFYAGDRLGGGILCHKTKPILTGLIITQNSAKRGGGIFGRGCEPTVINTVIGVNTALADGGGVGFVSGWLKHPTFKNVLIVENTATGNGGGMFMDYSTQAIMINSTISNNTAGVGHGGAIDRANQSAVNLTNSIVWNNGESPVYCRGETCYTSQISYSIVQLGQSATLINWGTGSIDTDPLFVGDGDYHLSSNSPALKAGTLSGAPTDDLEGLPRPNPIGSNPDMGAYESSSVNSVALTLTTVGNGTVTCNGGACQSSYPAGDTVNLVATPASGFTFKGWTVDCSGTNATTTVTMNAVKNCTATFEKAELTLTPSSILTNSQMGTTPPLNITLTGSCSSWTATTKPGGNITNLLVSPTSGTGNATITISYRKSSVMSPKKGNAKVSITASCGNGTPTVTKTVIIR